MKNAQKITRITREDLDSIFLWKAFWKLLKAETWFVFCLKVLLTGAAFTVLLLFLNLLAQFVGS